MVVSLGHGAASHGGDCWFVVQEKASKKAVGASSAVKSTKSAAIASARNLRLGVEVLRASLL